MLVWAKRNASFFVARIIALTALFCIVVVLHLAVTGALRQVGVPGGFSLLLSGGVVLALVLTLLSMRDWLYENHAARTEMRRMKMGLPSGPCCVVWHTPEAPARDGDNDGLQWDVVGPLRARYPKLARRLGIEGVAIAEFEVSADGRAKNIHCVDAWPSDVFYDAAREALTHARFEPKPDIHVRFGQSYSMPFVFRIAGAARLKDAGRHARKLRPRLQAAQQAVENLRRSA